MSLLSLCSTKGCFRIIELTRFYWLLFFFIGPIISVARVERTGAWELDLVN